VPTPDLDSLITSEETTRRITYRAKRLAAKFAFGDVDEDDLRQDFFLALLEAARNYQADRCEAEPFIVNVLDRRYKYHVRRLCQLAESSEHPDAAISMDDVERDYEYSIPDSHDVVEELEISLDVRTVVDGLPPRHRDICRWLLSGVGLDEIAARLSTTASTLVRDELPLIRRRFEEADLTPDTILGGSF